MRHKNLSLIGPPGSGKGSYGRFLAQALGLDLVIMSDVLKQFRPDLDLSSGRLIPDQVVSDVLLEGLLSKRDAAGMELEGYILDGFPRTLAQIHAMENTWPIEYQVQAAIKLAVPDRICERKSLGRRFCTKCRRNYNIFGVDEKEEGNDDHRHWYLPPAFPEQCPLDSGDWKEHCLPNYWSSRPDDHPEILKQRLSIYHHHMDPILHYFQLHDRLIRLTPYKGFEDVPDMIQAVRQWLEIHPDKTEQTSHP